MKKKISKRKPAAKKKVVKKVHKEDGFENASLINNANSTATLVKNGLENVIFGGNQNIDSTRVLKIEDISENTRSFYLSNSRVLLSLLYDQHGIIRTIIDLPIDDALRGGVEVSAENLSPEQISQLEAYLIECDDYESISRAAKYMRLFGGSALLIDQRKESESDFDITKIKKGSKIDFVVADLWELFWSSYTLEDDDSLRSRSGYQYYDPEVNDFNYYEKKINSTRSIVFKGLQVPSFTRPRVRGWGLSVLETLISSLNQYFRATNVAYEILEEAKIDVLGLEGLKATLMTPDGEANVRRFVELAQKSKNYKSMIVKGAEDTYDQKQLSFTGISEAMNSIRMQLASDARFPLTKLFGVSASGFNSGEDDIENYNSTIEATVRPKLRHNIKKVLEIRSMELFGFVPDALNFEFKTLRIPSALDEEVIKNHKYNRAIQGRQTGDLSAIDFKKIVNKGKLLPISLEVTDETFDVVSTDTNKDRVDSYTDAYKEEFDERIDEEKRTKK